MKAADVGYPRPPTNGSWQTDSQRPTGIDGPQWVLEYWSQLHNVFDFVRVEDIAYDKRPGMGNVVYVATGTAGASRYGGTAGSSTNGRVWKMVLDPTTRRGDVDSRSASRATTTRSRPNEIHQPDNIETTQTGFLVTEDPGSSQQFTRAEQAVTERNPRRALWYVPFSGTAPQVASKIDQSSDG
jgi:hypothetical protein